MEIDLNKTEAGKSSDFWKRLISIAVRVIVSILVLYFIFSLVEWKNVLIAYQAAHAQSIFYGGLLLLANLGVRIFKWRAMLYTVKNAPTFREAFGSVMLGISLGSFTPGEIGEFAGRALHITDAKRTHLLGLALLDKAQIFIVTSTAGMISLAFITLNNSFLIASITLVFVALSVILLMHMELLAKYGHRLNASLFRKSWITRILDGFSLLRPRQLYVTLLCTMAFHCVLVLQMFFLINAFSEITLFHAFIGTSAMMFVKSLLPISLGDLGIREAGSIFFFSTFGISHVAALNASLLLFIINVFLPSVIGTFFLRHQHVSLFKTFQFLKKTNGTTAQ